MALTHKDVEAGSLPDTPGASASTTTGNKKPKRLTAFGFASLVVLAALFWIFAQAQKIQPVNQATVVVPVVPVQPKALKPKVVPAKASCDNLPVSPTSEDVTVLAQHFFVDVLPKIYAMGQPGCLANHFFDTSTNSPLTTLGTDFEYKQLRDYLGTVESAQVKNHRTTQGVITGMGTMVRIRRTDGSVRGAYVYFFRDNAQSPWFIGEANYYAA